MPNPNKAIIVLVLDASGSMGPLQKDTIGSVNQFVKAQEAVPGECDFTLIQFSTGAPIVTFNAVPIGNVTPLTTDTYRPSGGTALLDAIGKAIDETGKKLAAMPDADRPGKVIVCVMTDGEENSSQEYSGDAGKKAISEMVKHQQEKYAWQFVFLGANIDSFTTATGYGMSGAMAINYQATPKGIRVAMRGLSANAAAYRSGGAVGMSWTPEQRKENEEADDK